MMYLPYLAFRIVRSQMVMAFVVSNTLPWVSIISYPQDRYPGCNPDELWRITAGRRQIMNAIPLSPSEIGRDLTLNIYLIPHILSFSSG